MDPRTSASARVMQIARREKMGQPKSYIEDAITIPRLRRKCILVVNLSPAIRPWTIHNELSLSRRKYHRAIMAQPSASLASNTATVATRHLRNATPQRRVTATHRLHASSNKIRVPNRHGSDNHGANLPPSMGPSSQNPLQNDAPKRIHDTSDVIVWSEVTQT